MKGLIQGKSHILAAIVTKNFHTCHQKRFMKELIQMKSPIPAAIVSKSFVESHQRKVYERTHTGE